MPHRQLEDFARYTPALILGYFAIQFLIRVGFSGNLETDEAEFVGRTYLALGYGNSHPPLYNWLVRGALEMTGGHWPAAVAMVKGVLLSGTYLLAYDIMRRITGRALPGLIVVASFMLVPQVVWKSQITLAHSVLLMFAVVAMLHAIVLIVERGSAWSFVWLGFAAAIGALAKYNFFLMFAAVLAAAASVPALRTKLFEARLGLSLGLSALLFAPHAIWALSNLQDTTRRMVKLERTATTFGVIDVPFLGLDGFLTLLAAIATWAGPLGIVWGAVRYGLPAAQTAAPQRERDFAAFFGRAALVGIGLFATIILLGDFHAVHERYVTPMLLTLPFWLALRWPLEAAPRAPVHFLRVAAVPALLMVTAWPGWIAFGREQLAYPYAAFASVLPRTDGASLAILADQEKYAANLALRLPDAGIWGQVDPPQEVAIVWREKSDQAPAGLVSRLGNAYEPRGEMVRMSFPYQNFSGRKAELKVRLYARKP